MKKNRLEEQLHNIQGFNKPNPKKEQYATPTSIARKLIQAQDLQGQTVLDLGAGTGILGIAALLAGAKHVTFIEEDAQAIKTLQENLKAQGISQEQYTIIHSPLMLTDVHADVAVMNPPFGTRIQHLDRFFLEYALTHTHTISTLHKTSTKEFIHKRIQQLGAQVIEEEDLQYVLQHTMSHHTKEQEVVEVTRFCIKKL